MPNFFFPTSNQIKNTLKNKTKTTIDSVLTYPTSAVKKGGNEKKQSVKKSVQTTQTEGEKINKNKNCVFPFLFVVRFFFIFIFLFFFASPVSKGNDENMNIELATTAISRHKNMYEN